MRILVIGINYAPEEAGNAPYTTGLCEHLASFGHEVHVLTGVPHYPRWRKDGRERLAEHRGTVNGVRLHRRSHYVPGSQSALRRAIYEASFLVTGSSLMALPRPDAIIGIIPALADGVLARLASWRFRAPYGLVFQDLMGQAASQSGVTGGASVARITRTIEGWVARGAARVAVVSDGFAGYIEGLGVQPARITKVRNWGRSAAGEVDRAAARRRLGWPQDAFVCLHAGNMGHKQGLASVIEAADLARIDSGVLFGLIGDGNQRSELVRNAACRQLDNVWFGGTLGDDDYASALAGADALLLNQSPSVRDMAFPSKLASYLQSGTPVIAAVAPESEAGRELSQAGAALLVPPGDPAALLRAVRQLKNDEDAQQQLSYAGKELASSQYSRESALSGLQSFVESIASPSPTTDRSKPAISLAPTRPEVR